MPARTTKKSTAKPVPDGNVVAQKMSAATKASGTTAKRSGNGSTPKPDAPTAIVADEEADPGSTSRRIAAAKAEDKAHKAWERDGRKGAEPATPNLDALKAKSANGGVEKRARRSSNSGSSPRVTPTVKWYRRGTLLKDSMHKLSTVAYFFTKGINGHPERMPAKEFRALLVEQYKVTEPEASTWRVVLPNGEDIGAVAPGDKLPDLSAADAKKVTVTPRGMSAGTKQAPAPAATSTRSPAKKTTTGTKRPAAKKAAAKPAAKRTK